MSLEDEEAALTPDLPPACQAWPAAWVWQLKPEYVTHFIFGYHTSSNVQCYYGNRGIVPGTGQVNWNHILFAVNIVIKCSEDVLMMMLILMI